MSYTNGLDNPELYFQSKIWSGTGSENAITLDGDEDMSPNLVWIKQRNGTTNHILTDTVRSATKSLNPEATNTESTDAQALKSFDSDGFTIGTDTDVNGSGGTGGTYVAWCWKESNSDAGMDIVTWTGNGSSQNISHSLSAVPHFMITKNRSATGDWTTYHQFGGGTKTFYLSNTDAIGTTSSPWNNTDPTSSVFSVGGGAYTNGSGNSIIGYLWTEKQGFSKFGSYTGNGVSSGGGPFVYLGFRPALIIIKNTASTPDWVMFDNKRVGYNTAGNEKLYPNNTNAEADITEIDLLSNGFKLHTDGSETNTSGSTYIYMAFAEAPFVNSKGVPCNAR